MAAVDDYEALKSRIKALKEGRATEYDYVDHSPKPGSLSACPHCGRTVEKPAYIPCPGKCGLPPGGRAGQGPAFDGWC